MTARASGIAFGSPRIPYESLDLSPWRSLPPETWSRHAYLAEALIEALVDAACLAVLSDLGIRPGPIGRTVNAMAESAGVAPERKSAFLWILAKLAASGRLEGDLEGDVEALHAPDPNGDSDDAAALRETMPGLRDSLGSTAALIHQARLAYPDFLRGRNYDRAALFGPRGLGLWERYFQNGNVSYATVNRLAAEAAAVSSREGPLAILEVGGGFASGTEALLDRLGDRARSVWFTDVVPYFVARSAASLPRRYESVSFEFRRVDLDAPLREQGVPAASFDLVYAVNTLHAVRDLVASLRELAGALREGGTLVLGEAIRPRPGSPVPIEFVFRLMPEFSEIVTDPFLRSTGGFLYFEEWRRVLERAGLEFRRFVPDLRAAVASYPNHSVAAVVASRGGRTS